MALEATGQSPSVANSPIQTTEAEELKPEQEEQALAEDVISSPNEMEVDQFNSNPCMDFLVKIVRRMHKTIAPPTGDTSKMPLWMGELNKTFKAQGKTWRLLIWIMILKPYLECRHSVNREAIPGKVDYQLPWSFRELCKSLDTTHDDTSYSRRSVWRANELLCSGKQAKVNQLSLLLISRKGSLRVIDCVGSKRQSK